MITELLPAGAVQAFATIQPAKRMDDFERAMVEKCPTAKIGHDCDTLMPLTHRFTPGLYCREIFMPKGTLLTSKIHKTEHQFIISKGSVSVWTEDGGVTRLTAPFHGITKPGTRRILYIHEDTIWTTFHPTTETNLEKLEAELIFPHTEHLLEEQ
jgi:hypothetical protein